MSRQLEVKQDTYWWWFGAKETYFNHYTREREWKCYENGKWTPLSVDEGSRERMLPHWIQPSDMFRFGGTDYFVYKLTPTGIWADNGACYFDEDNIRKMKLWEQ